MREIHPPKVDGRRRTEIREETLARLESYTSVDPDTEGVGTALVSLFAEMAEEVVERLDRTPEKHRVAFFDALGFDRDPPQVARLPLVFSVAKGLTENVPIAAGTQAVSETDQAFEVPVGEGFEATPARLKAVYSVSPDDDAIFEHHTDLDEGEGIRFFTGSNGQEHRLYLGDTDFFTLSGEMTFEVRIEGSNTEAFADDLSWQYYGTRVEGDEAVEGWHGLEDRGAPDFGADSTTLRFALPEAGEIIEANLPEAEGGDEADATQSGGDEEIPPVTELETRWVRCSAPADPDEGVYGAVVESVSLSIDSGAELTPDMLLSNDVPLPVRNGDGDERSDDESENGTARHYPFGENPLPLDTFYIASDEAFTKGDAQVTLDFGTNLTFESALPPYACRPPDPNDPSVTASEPEPEPLDLSWEYWNGSGWATLAVGRNELAEGNAQIGFTVPADLEPTGVSGHEHHWIRARVLEDGYVAFERVAEDDGGDKEMWAMIHPQVPSFSSLTLELEYESGSAQPPGHVVSRNNLAYGEDVAEVVRSAAGSAFSPFEKLPDELEAVPKQAIYLGFDGPLEDGPIQLLFSAADKLFESGFYPRARWEYWSPTTGWTRLSADDGTEGLTRRGIVGLTFSEATIPFERFGRRRHWIRARLLGDPFTVDLRSSDDSPALSIDSVDAKNERITIRNDGPRKVDLADYHLDVEYGQPATQVRSLPEGSSVPPDRTLVVGTGVKAEAPYDVTLGFDRWVLNDKDPDTVALLTPDRTVVAISGEQTVTTAREDGEDEVSLSSPTGACLAPCPTDAPLVLDTTPEEDEAAPVLSGIYPNAGWADNVRTVTGETIGSSDGSTAQTLSFASRPVIDETVRVDEVAALSTDERAELVDRHPDRVNEQTDADGTTVAFWVDWAAVEDFVESAPEDRHYVIDRVDGTLTFGDGTRGMIPPAGDENVTADYRTGGGVAGNVPAGNVTSLTAPPPFVEEVVNPEPGNGGSDAETTARATHRASRTLRDRNRAVTRGDVERLAMAASRELERVRCIPGMDEEGESRTGWVTVLLVPRTVVPKPVPSPEVKRRVEETLKRYAPAPLTGPRWERVTVRGPSYVEVVVETDLVVTENTSSITTVEEAAIDGLESFLHPLTGGPRDDGWGFGELPCVSDLYALLEAVEGVDHVDGLDVTFRADGRDRSVTVSDGDPSPEVAVDTLVFSGTHLVQGTGEMDRGAGLETTEEAA